MKYLLTLVLIVACALPLYAKSDKKKEKPQTEYEVALNQSIADCRAFLAAKAENNEAVLSMFDKTTSLWKKHYVKTQGQFAIRPLLDAVAFAALKHEGQYRKDAAHTPYIIHPIGVSRILWEEGKVRSVNVLIASLLHDTLEDTATTSEEIFGQFGSRVCFTVEELTNDPALSSQDNKQRQVDHAREMTLNAQLVKLADRLYNVRDVKNTEWPEENKNRYLQWGAKLLEALRGTNAGLEKALEEELAKP